MSARAHTPTTGRAGARIRSLLLATGAIALLAPPSTAQTPAESLREADAHYDAGRYAESSRAFQQAIDRGAENPAIFYNAACSASLAGEVDIAFDRLEAAIAHGWLDVALTTNDPDLDALRSDARWETTLADLERAREAFRASLAAPDLLDELLVMRRVDQAARGAGSSAEPDPARMVEVDSLHTARMKEIVAEHGWPTKRLVGEDGARAAWLLVQHADRHPDFQRECLELMKAAAPDQVAPVNVAYLTDRVLVNAGEPQIYGTQFWRVNGEMTPRPIAEPAKVESLRAQVGMESMQDYHLRMTGRDWDPGE